MARRAVRSDGIGLYVVMGGARFRPASTQYPVRGEAAHQPMAERLSIEAALRDLVRMGIDPIRYEEYLELTIAPREAEVRRLSALGTKVAEGDSVPVTSPPDREYEVMSSQAFLRVAGEVWVLERKVLALGPRPETVEAEVSSAFDHLERGERLGPPPSRSSDLLDEVVATTIGALRAESRLYPEAYAWIVSDQVRLALGMALPLAGAEPQQG